MFVKQATQWSWSDLVYGPTVTGLSLRITSICLISLTATIK